VPNKKCKPLNIFVLTLISDEVGEIGDNVTLAPNVTILAHDASMKNTLNFTKIAKVKIGNNVFIGANSVILPGISIGDNVIIGAGSVVSKSIPSNSVAAGNPCKVIKSFDQFIEEHSTFLKTKPVYGKEFTLKGNITKENKLKMSRELENSFGYII